MLGHGALQSKREAGDGIDDVLTAAVEDQTVVAPVNLGLDDPPMVKPGRCDGPAPNPEHSFGEIGGYAMFANVTNVVFIPEKLHSVSLK
jgi:hypothetical protein